MGATTGQKRISQSLSFKHELFRLDSLDGIITNGFDLVKRTELFRCKFTPLWNEFIKQSGAIVLASPHFESSMSGMLMKLSCDLNGNLFKNVFITQSMPFLTIDKGEVDISTDSLQIIQAFKLVSQYAIENTAQIDELASSYQKFIREVGFLQKDHEKYFSSRGVPPIDRIEKSRKLTKYLKTFQTGNDICNQMRLYVKEVVFCLKEYEEYSTKEEVMTKYERIGKEAHRTGMTKPPKIMFKYSPEKKIGNYEDYYDRVRDYAKMDKNCNQILSFYCLTLREDRASSLKQSTTSAKKEENNKMIEECKDSSEMTEERRCIDCLKSKEGVCLLCRKGVDSNGERANDEQETPKRSEHDQKINIDNNVIVSHLKEEGKKVPSMNLDDDDIIDNVDSDEIEDSKEDMNKASKSKEKEEEIIKGSQIQLTSPSLQGITSIATLHLKETINIYSQSNVYPTSFECLPNRNAFATGLSNGALIITNTTSLTEEKVILRHSKKITSLLYLSDGKTLISASKDGSIYKHNLDNYDSHLIGNEPSVSSMVNLFDNTSILVAANTEVIAYDYINSKKLYAFTAHDDKIKDMAYHLSKDMLITCSKDKKIKIWNSANQECIGVLKGINHSITSLCFAQKKDQLVVGSASKDGFVTFWNLSDKNLTKSFKMKTRSIKLFYLENERNVMGVNENNTLTVFDLETNDYKDFNSNATEMKYSNGFYFNDGNSIAVGAKNGTVQLWCC